MIHSFTSTPFGLDVYSQRRRADLSWRVWFVMLLGMTALTAFFMFSTRQVPLAIGGLMLFVALTAYQPRYGLYVILFAVLLGDALLLPSYPFVKNFSSPESLFYLHDSLIFSPLEFCLVLVLLFWLGKAAMQRKITFYGGVLFWPALLFALSLSLGLVYGLGTGGNSTIALWEIRPILYLFSMLIFVSNLLQKPEHISHMIWLCMIALGIEGVSGSFHYFIVLKMNLAGVERITEHSAAIHMNTLFVLVLAAWLYKASPAKRFLLPLLMPAVLITYLATQRRAAFLSLGVALVLMAFMLYQENRRVFWRIVPIMAVISTIYIGIFWNSQGALGLPAQALKSVVAPEQGSSDTLSNLYREVENNNVSYTISRTPLMGVGFGNKFYIIQPMPDISFFIWWEYIIHNSIFWIWLKAGVFGFLAMLFLVGFSIMTGVRTLRDTPHRDLKAIALTATLYLIMHFLYAYVDMSWDNQSMIYIGAMLGVINVLDRTIQQKISIRNGDE